MNAVAPISWAETRSRMASDHARLRRVLREAGREPVGWLALHPSYTAVWLHRVSHFLHRGGHRWLARFVWHLNLLVVGADISPASEIGGGFVMLNPVAVTIFANIGRDFTVMAFCGLGALPSRQDIGAGPGLPILGDDVELAPFAGVLGPVRLGNGVRVGAGCIVTEDLPDGAIVARPVPRILPSLRSREA